MENQPPQIPPAPTAPYQQPAPVTPPPQSGVSPEKAKAKKRFFVWLIIWLCAWPVSFITAILGSRIFGGIEALETIFNLISLLLGLYGFIGWIPVLIVGIIWGTKK